MTVVNSTAPVISGTPKVGQTLQTSNGTWTFDLDYLTYTYRWLRCDAAGDNCVAISGATSAQYTLLAADLGSTVRSEVTASEHANVPSPPTGAYWVSDWRTGTVSYDPAAFDAGEPWATIFSYTAPGYLDCGLFGGSPHASSPDGRVSVIANPYGSGNVLKCEIRDSDPGLSGAPNLAKSEVGSYKVATWPDGSFSMGEEIWIHMELYLPNEFSFATGGSNPFTLVADLHPNSNSGISALELANYPGSYLQLHCGVSPNSQRINFIPLDSAHRNRKLDIILGAKISNTAGWVEGWLDGVNTIQRRNLPMASADENGPYWKQGLYTSSDASFVGGRCIVYHGRTWIGTTKANVE